MGLSQQGSLKLRPRVLTRDRLGSTKQGGSCPLSKRQLQVLLLASHGYGEKETAAALYLEHLTVKEHRKHAYRTLAARNCAHAVAICIRQGWL